MWPKAISKIAPELNFNEATFKNSRQMKQKMECQVHCQVKKFFSVGPATFQKKKLNVRNSMEFAIWYLFEQANKKARQDN